MFRTNKKLFLLGILCALVISLLTGCGSKETAQTDGPAVPEKNKIVIQNFNFIPNTVTINKGDTLTWVNNDANPHNITGKGISSGILNITDSFSQTFKEAGSFEYSCDNYPEMKGIVIVK